MTTTSETEIITVAIDIPLGELPPGYETQLAARGRINFGRTHLQVQLKQDEAEMMLRLREGLIDTKAMLETGQRVVSNADALRWLLAQLRASESRPQQTKAIVETAMQESEESSKDEEQVGTSPSEDDLIAEYLNKHGLDVTNKEVMEVLREQGVVVQSPQVTAVKKQLEEQLAE